MLPTAPLNAQLVPTVTLVHAGATLTAVEPVLTRSTTITPATGAYGDTLQVSFSVQQVASSSRFTYGIEVCDTPNTLQFNPASVMISGIVPAPTARDRPASASPCPTARPTR